MNWIIITIDSIVYFVMFVTVVYLFIFALYSLRKNHSVFKTAKKQSRIVIFFPAYKEDMVIESSVSKFIEQGYPSEMYDIIVISDHMLPQTVERLSQLPIKVLEVDFENSSKAKALNFALDSLADSYDIAVILDADNTTDTDFLENINNAYSYGMKAIQTHRLAKNRNTDTAVLDALSEEINNSIFRKGHVNMGFSSALVGSGMAFDYKWFKAAMKKVSSMGEDKELEVLLLKDEIYIEYLENVKVYDEKTQRSSAFYNQRRRWLAAQFEILGKTLKYFPSALASGNFDYCNKMVQWMLLPRSIVMVIIAFMAIVLTFIDWFHAIKWWILFILMLFTLSIATPDYLVDAKFYKAMRKLPLLGTLMILNMLRLRGASKKFIHTNHTH